MDDNGKEVEMNSPEEGKKSSQESVSSLTKEQIEERAKTVAPLNVSAEDLTKKVVESQREEIPLALPGTHPVITEELKAFEKALKTGEYAGMKVLGEVSHGWRRGLKVEMDGQPVILDLGVHEIVNAGVIPDPEIADLSNSETARAWVEKVLRSFERNEDRKITQQVEDSLTATISSKIPLNMIDPATGGIYIHTDPNGRPEGLSQELIRLVEARVAYHNSGLSARLGLGNLGEEYGGITLNEHQQIFNTPGVKEAIAELEVGAGAFYRMTGAAPGAERDRIRILLRTVHGVGNPAFLGREDDAATLALELAEKTMHIHGESGYYTGIWDIHGNNIRFTGPNMLEQYARYFEDHWNEIAFYRDPTSGVPLVDTRGGFPGVAVTPETLSEYIDYINITSGPAAAAALAPLVGGASWNQLGGEGALHEKGTYHMPLFLENPQSPNRGQAGFLRRYAYSWVSSGVRFSRLPNDPAARTSMVVAINNYDRDWAKWFIWTARVSGAHKGRGVFAEKFGESILNNPLIDPNAVTTNNSFEALPKALENFIKTKDAYVGLPNIEQQRAMAHLLKGILIYVNSPEARTDGFSFSGWNNTIRRNAINWAANEHLITSQQAKEIMRELRINENLAALREGSPQYSEAPLGLFSAMLKGIFRR